MFADTLLDLERAHLLRLMLWGGISAATGIGVLAVLTIRRTTSPLLKAFGLVTTVWGGGELLVATALRPTLALRDLAAAARMERLLWLETGLDVAIIAIGVACAAVAWRLGRPSGGSGPRASVVSQSAPLAETGGPETDRNAEGAAVVGADPEAGPRSREIQGLVQSGPVESPGVGGWIGRGGGGLGVGIGTIVQGVALLALHGSLAAHLYGLI